MQLPSSTNQPFFFRAKPTGILCVHGFTGSPYEMRYLGERLHEAGYTVFGIRLPGHESPSSLAKTEYSAWTKAISEAVDELIAQTQAPIGIAGLSMGGALSLHAAARLGTKIAAVASFSAPIYLADNLMKLIEIAPKVKLPSLLPYVPKIAGSDVEDPEAKRLNPALAMTPTAATLQLAQVMKETERALPYIEQPVFLSHGMRDRTVPPSNLDAIAAKLTRSQVETLVFPASRHLLTLDVDRESVARAALRFFEKMLPLETTNTR